MIRNITSEIKKAIAVDAPWSFNDFYYIIELLEQKGFGVSHWRGEENWAGISESSELVAYVWLKYPLIFIKADHADEISFFVREFSYIILITCFDLNSEEFMIDMDKELRDRINYQVGKDNFSANDMWFYTSN
jgi:hypothetical protein